MDSAIALIQQVRYFKGSLTSKAKFHISVGHATVMATVTFFGAREIALKQKQEQNKQTLPQQQYNVDAESSSKHSRTKESNVYTNNVEKFNFQESFLQQDEYIYNLDDEVNETSISTLSLDKHVGDNDDDERDKASHTHKKKMFPLHYAILEFQTPVFCPMKSLIIGSKLDTDIQANTCRLAFSGRLIEKLDKDPFITGATQVIKLYTQKEKCGLISRLGEPFRLEEDGPIVRFEVYGSELFKKETDMNLFLGLKVQTTQGDIGVIQSSYGTAGSFKVFFPAGTMAKVGDKLILGYKRFLHDEKKIMHQDIILPKPRVGTRVIQDVEESGMKTKHRLKKSDKKTPTSNINVVAVSQPKPKDSERNNPQDILIGEICTIKDDILINGLPTVVIVSGLFTPDIDIRDFVGSKVQVMCSSKEEGQILGPFGKAGKCKVSFPQGISSPLGSKVQRHKISS